MKILVIDDSVDTLVMLEKYLTLNGHECHTTNNGLEGLALINQNNFDAVFLDLVMQDFSGYEVIEQLVQNGRIRQNKIIVFTAGSLKEEQVDNLLSKGICTVLRKPVELRVLTQPLLV